VNPGYDRSKPEDFPAGRAESPDWLNASVGESAKFNGNTFVLGSLRVVGTGGAIADPDENF
jgi:hypothetical protein